MSKEILFRTNLQLFAEGGDGGAADNGAPAMPTEGVSAQDANAQTEPARDLDAEFEALIKGDFKDTYNKRMQDTVQKRLKSSKETVDKYNSLSPVLEMLGQKYGVDASDADALNNAILEDTSFYEDEAMERGISVEQLKEIKKMERENAEFRKMLEAREEEERVHRNIAKWMEQAEEAKKIYPGLDLQTELNNPDFIKMCESGIDVGTAYFALHSRELVPQAMQFAAKTAAQNTTNKIKSNGLRPTENGLKNNASATVTTDVRNMSKEKRAEIIQRVMNGEKITFRN